MDNSSGIETGGEPAVIDVHEPFTLTERFQQLAEIDNVRGTFPLAPVQTRGQAST